MGKRSASASQPQNVSMETKMVTISPVSSRSLDPKLIQVVEKFRSEGVSNQAYIVNGVQVVWVGPKKTLYYGPDRKEAVGETMNDAITAAGIA